MNFLVPGKPRQPVWVSAKVYPEHLLGSRCVWRVWRFSLHLPVTTKLLQTLGSDLSPRFPSFFKITYVASYLRKIYKFLSMQYLAYNGNSALRDYYRFLPKSRLKWFPRVYLFNIVMRRQQETSKSWIQTFTSSSTFKNPTCHFTGNFRKPCVIKSISTEARS